MLYLHLYICGIPPHMDNEHSWEMGQSYSLLLCDHILASVVHIIHTYIHVHTSLNVWRVSLHRENTCHNWLLFLLVRSLQ